MGKGTAQRAREPIERHEDREALLRLVEHWQRRVNAAAHILLACGEWQPTQAKNRRRVATNLCHIDVREAAFTARATSSHTCGRRHRHHDGPARGVKY
jgi:hypothetical protein